MNRCVVLVGRMLVVVAIIMSFAVTRPGAAEGLNSLTFSFSICPEWEDTCQPYGNTDARIMELATGIEQWAINDAQGLVTFSGLADGQYAFSVPSVQQKSISITCGDDATGMIVGSQMGDNGPQVGLAGGQSITCSGVMIPFGPSDVDEGPTEDHSDSAILSVYTSECPVGYTGSDYAADCGNPADASIYTAYIGYGTVPNSTTLTSALNQYGYATFGGLPADHYSVMVGSESATVGAVSCDIFDASGSGEGTSIAPNLGGRGYELDLVEGGSADCSFAMIPTGDDTPSAAPSASDEPATSDKPAASATARPSAQASTAAGTTVTLPNTGTGSAAGSVDGTTIFAVLGLALGSVLLLLLVALGVRRSSVR